MDISSFITPALTLMAFCGMVVMTIAYFRMQSKNGGNEANKDLNTTTQEVITTYKTQVEQYKEQLKNYRQDMHDLTLKIGELQGMLVEKDKQNTELKQLILGRNPEIESFYKKAIPVIEQVKEFMETSGPILDEVKKYIEATPAVVTPTKK